MKNKLLVIGIIAVLVITISVGVWAQSLPAEVWVDDGYTESSCGGHTWGKDAFNNIQGGIGGVDEGGTVNVAAGTYNENLVMNKSLNLIGAQFDVDPRTSEGGRTGNESIIDGGNSGSIITVRANNIIINGFTIQNAGSGGGCVWIDPNYDFTLVKYNKLSSEYGVFIDDHCENVNVQYNNILDCSRGIMARNNRNDEVVPTFQYNDFYDNVYGIKLYGIAEGTSQVLVYDNYFEDTSGTGANTSYGIYGYISSFHAKGNTFKKIGVLCPDFFTYYGAIAGVGCTSTPGWHDINRCVIEENIFTQTTAPAVNGYFCDYLVRNNSITSDYIALWIKGGTGYDPNQSAYAEWTIEENTIAGNSGNSGIYATGGGYGQSALSATVNTITGFDNGIKLVNDGNIVAKITVNYNKIYGNTSYGITNVSANAIADASLNWWGDASGPGEVGPGIGDKVSNNVDYAPWYIDEGGTLSNETKITSYKFEAAKNTALSSDVIGTIDSGSYSVSLTVPYGTDVTDLVATFTLSTGATAKIEGTDQVSGTTANNFNSSITYTITSLDETGTQNWTVTVTLAAASNVATLSDLTVDGTTITGFDSSTLIYDKELPYGTTIVPTVAATTTDSKATKEITQAANLTGTEAQRTATVVVTAEDGTTTKTYKVIFGFIKVTITKTGPASANQGNNITYTITYKNEGTFNATGVVVTETYPSKVEYVSAIPAPDSGFNNQWTIGTLAPDAEGTITVTVHIK